MLRYTSLDHIVLDVSGVRPAPSFLARVQDLLRGIAYPERQVVSLEGHGLVWIQVLSYGDSREDSRCSRLWPVFPAMSDDEIRITIHEAVRLAKDESMGAKSGTTHVVEAMYESMSLGLERRLRDRIGSPQAMVAWLEAQSVDGVTLSDWLAEGRLDVVQVYLDQLEGLR